MPPSISRQLLTWFHKKARPLPWRENRDPYRIWISEIMLQQTQVATVIPFFERFLKRYPNLRTLARGDEQTVLRLWEGLGYYRRARDLLRAAKILVKHKHATVPDDAELLRTLPGFGRYTTNAVLSQAYDRRLPILEANSQRLLCRLFGIDQNPKDAAVQKKLWQHAEQLLPKHGAGDFNQALMELGALICTPTNPKCSKCPLRRVCRARLEERQEELPLRATAADVISINEVAVVIKNADRFLLVQRSDAGRWARMWEFPHQQMNEAESVVDAARRLLTMLGIEGRLGAELTTIRHSVTHHRIRMTCIAANYLGGQVRTNNYADHAWIRTKELNGYALSTPQRRLARLVQEKHVSGATCVERVE